MKQESELKEKYPHITKVLVSLAKRMCDNPEQYSIEEGKNLDRALRTCPDIYDIHTVWVLWSYVAEKQGWLTGHEMILKKGRYVYERTIPKLQPRKFPEDEE